MTSRQFTADQLADMRTAQTEHMLDAGVIQTRTQTADSFGQPIETFADGSEIAIGLDMRPGSERRGADLAITTYDATARLGITNAPTVGDRLKITKRFGEVLGTALIFDIVSPIQRGPSGIRIALQRVET